MSLPRYQQYKDSGVEWIGEIPTGWGFKKIKYLAHGEGTLFLDGDWIESKDIVFDDSQIRYITTGNIGEGKYKEQGLTYITDETFKKLNCTEIFPGDLLISRLNPPIGRCCIVPDLGSRIVTSVDNVVLRPSGQYQKEFLKYVMSSPRYFEYTSLIARGATMQRISRGLLGDVELPITFDGSEQTAIASFLDRKTAEIDQLIANKEKLIALYEEEKTAIINRAVTRGLDPSVTTKPSGVDWLGDIPEHWGVKRLKYVAFIKYGLGQPPKDKSDGLPIIRATNVFRGKIDTNNLVFVDPADVPYERDPILREDDIIVVRSGAYTADSAIIPKEFDGAVAGYDMVIRCYRDIPKFISYCLLSNYVLKKQLLLHAIRAAQPHLNREELGETIILLPPRTEQSAIVSHIETECSRLDTIIDKFKKQIELFKEYRTTLISEVVTGKIDIRGEVAA